MSSLYLLLQQSNRASLISKTCGNDFQEHIKNLLAKVSKTIGLLRKLQNILPRGALFTIFKSLVRPHLDYDDVIYDQSYNSTFHQKMETIQYNAAIAIIGAIRGSSREKLYQELRLESLQQRRWYRKFCYFFKLTKNKSPKYLFNNILTVRSTYRTRNMTKFLNSMLSILFQKFILPIHCNWVEQLRQKYKKFWKLFYL